MCKFTMVYVLFSIIIFNERTFVSIDYFGIFQPPNSIHRYRLATFEIRIVLLIPSIARIVFRRENRTGTPMTVD